MKLLTVFIISLPLGTLGPSRSKMCIGVAPCKCGLFNACTIYEIVSLSASSLYRSSIVCTPSKSTLSVDSTHKPFRWLRFDSSYRCSRFPVSRHKSLTSWATSCSTSPRPRFSVALVISNIGELWFASSWFSTHCIACSCSGNLLYICAFFQYLACFSRVSAIYFVFPLSFSCGVLTLGRSLSLLLLRLPVSPILWLFSLCFLIPRWASTRTPSVFVFSFLRSLPLICRLQRFSYYVRVPFSCSSEWELNPLCEISWFESVFALLSSPLIFGFALYMRFNDLTIHLFY